MQNKGEPGAQSSVFDTRQSAAKVLDAVNKVSRASTHQVDLVTQP